jgi:hypothetical protein
MGKKESYKQDLQVLFEKLLKENQVEDLIKYLLDNSNLPSPQGNLGLAEMFVEIIEELKFEHIKKLNDFIMHLLKFTANEAPVNDPKEFLPFCGVWALGSIGTIESYAQIAMSKLKTMAKDPRWRIREGVAKAITLLVKYNNKRFLNELENWLKTENNWLVMRAIVAGLAERGLDEYTYNKALEFHKKIINKINNNANRNSEEFKALRKGLGYTLSVIVQLKPILGFKYMEKIAISKDKDIIWIVKNNLSKNRLIKNFPDEVNQIKKLML